MPGILARVALPDKRGVGITYPSDSLIFRRRRRRGQHHGFMACILKIQEVNPVFAGNAVQFQI